jgi:hypothetical protein
MSENHDLCKQCGAPRQPGFAACKYCKTPFVQNAHTEAIPCPKCATLNEMGAQKCVQCQTWVVVQCVFCHALSPHNRPACMRCNEPFAGAPQRFQERQQQAASQRNMQMVGTVGNVAASLVGAAAGAMIAGRAYGGGHHHYDHGHGHYGRRDYDGDYDPSNAGPFGGGSGDYGGGASGDYSDPGDAGGDGGGIMDSLFGGGDSGGSSDYSDPGDAGGDGGGIMDSLFDGGGSDE